MELLARSKKSARGALAKMRGVERDRAGVQRQLGELE